MPKKPTTYFNPTATHGKNDPFMLLGNPLRGLTPARVVSLLEEGERGEWREAQWLFRMVCKLDADVLTIRKRRLSAIRKRTWKVKITESKAKALGASGLEMAGRQQAALNAYYESIENLGEAVEHLATAPLCGFAHVGIQGTRLDPLDQWWWLRAGTYGAWLPNAELLRCSAIAAPAEEFANPADWLTLEDETPLIWIAILKWCRANASQKWWDAFCEVFSKRGTIIVAPPAMASDKVGEFQESAERVARGGSGALPGGSTVFGTNAITGGGMPFRDHMAFLRETVILAGTGGMLTSLAGGSAIGGGGPADVQQDAFEELADADCARISEVFQAQCDKPRLATQFPGQPVLAYFELSADEATDPGVVLDHAGKAKIAGFDMDAAELSERTGYKLVKAVQTGGLNFSPPAPPEGARGTGSSTAIPPAAGGTAGAPASGGVKNRAYVENGVLLNSGRGDGWKGASPAQEDLKRLEEAALKQFGPEYRKIAGPFLDKAKAAKSASELQAILDGWQADPQVKAAMADIVARTAFSAQMRGYMPADATVSLKPLPFAEALKFWEEKIPGAPNGTATDKLLNATWEQAQRYGFKVAGITETTVLDGLKADIGEVVAGNVTPKEFVALAQDKYGLNAAHAETVVRTNAQTAYQFGHYQQLKAVEADMPIWGFDIVDDNRTSATCRALKNLAYPASHPIWNTLYPPNHFNCRTTVVAFESQEEAEAQGFKVVDAWPRDPQSGAYYMPGRGFEMNIGQAASLDALLPGDG